MKILDRYILVTFLKTFFPLFIIILLIFILQMIWLFISELAGKDIDILVILKFLLYGTPRLIPMILPLTILLTSIMTFGNFAENYEFAAMKSSGISLQRAMRVLSVFIVLLGFGAFFFSNVVMPSAEKKFINLRKNLVKVKPAMAIAPNQFNDLGDINIKVAEKYGENDEFLKDVIIHKKASRAGNFTVIKAKEGELMGSVDSELISLVLSDGNYYDEVQQSSPKQQRKLPLAKAHFEKYTINIDLSSFNDVDLNKEQYKKGPKMLNVNELGDILDSLSGAYNADRKSMETKIEARNGISELNRDLTIEKPKVLSDTVKTYLEYFTNKEKSQVYKLAFSNVDGLQRNFRATIKNAKVKRRFLNKYEMTLHDKYALGIACVLLFFVGAPLGAIIRKGGLGLPIIIGVIIFLSYHFIGLFANNSAEEGGIPTFLGSWLSTFIIFPLSIFFTYRATRDRGVTNMDAVIQPIKEFFQKRFSKSK